MKPVYWHLTISQIRLEVAECLGELEEVVYESFVPSKYHTLLYPVREKTLGSGVPSKRTS